MPEPRRLYGREEEQAQLTNFLDKVQAGHALSTVIEGPSGIGKTSLLTETIRSASQKGIIVSRYQHPADSSRLEGDLREDHPHLLVIDDIETCAANSLQELQALTDDANTSTIGILASRGAQRHGDTSIFDDVHSPENTIALPPLTERYVHEVVSDLIGVPPQPSLWDVVACASGNPRFIVEMIEGLREERRIEPNGELVRLRQGALPARVRATIDHYVRQLPADSLQLLRVGTVLGQVFQLSDAARMLDTNTAALLPALDKNFDKGILAFTDDGILFQHPVVRRAIYESIPRQIRSTLHQEAYRIARQTQSTTVAGPGDLVFLGAQETTQTLRKVGPGNGAGIVGAVHTLLKTGYLESAVVLARTALDRTLPRHETAELRCLLTDILVMSGRTAEAVEEADQVLSEEATGQQSLDALAASRLFGLIANDQESARLQAENILDQLGPDGSSSETVSAATALSALEWNSGNVREALRWGDQAVHSIDQSIPPAGRVYSRLGLAWKLSCLGEFERAESLIEAAQVDISHEGLSVYEPALEVVRSALWLRSGREGAAKVAAKSALEAADRTGVHSLVPVASSVLCQLEIYLGNLSAAAEHLNRCRSGVPLTTPFSRVHYEWLSLRVRTAQAGLHEVATMLSSGHLRFPDLRPLLLEQPSAAAWFVRIALCIEDGRMAQAALRAVEDLAKDNPDITVLDIASRHARSLHARDIKGVAQVMAQYTDPCAKGCASEDLSELIADLAPQQGTQSIPEFPERETQTDIESSVNAPHPGTSFTDTDQEVLGETENTIAKLVANGLTDREIAKEVFLSAHTVNYYLRRIYGKLGINSRIELTRWVLSTHE